MGERSTSQKMQRNLIRSGPKNGPDYQRNKKQGEREQPGTKKRPDYKKPRRKRGISDASSEDTEFLRVISDAWAELGRCVVPNPWPIGVCSVATDSLCHSLRVSAIEGFSSCQCVWKHDAMPIYKCLGTRETVNVSTSAGGRGKPPMNMDHISEKIVSDFRYGMVHMPHRLKKNDENFRIGNATPSFHNAI